MGNMRRIDLHIKKAARSQCWGAGFVAMDIVDSEIGEFAATGGSCGNVMAILAWLGWHATPVARLGQDVSGEFIRSELGATGVDTRCLSREAGVRSPVVIQRFAKDKNGGRVHRFSLTCPECGAWLPRHRPITLQQANEIVDTGKSPKAYFFDRVSPGTLRLATTARDKGAVVIFEPSSIGDEKKFQTAVDLCHVLKYSQDRFVHVPDLSIAPSPKLIVETQGQAGLRYRWRNRWTHLDAIKADPVVDAAGSGDWCTAGLIHRLGQTGAKGLRSWRKSELVTALQTGQALAAVNCCFFGARGAMLAMTHRQLNNRLRRLEIQPEVKQRDSEAMALTPAEPPVDFCQQCDPIASTIGKSDNSQSRLSKST